MNDLPQNDSPDVSKLDTGRLLLIAAFAGVVLFGGWTFFNFASSPEFMGKFWFG